MPGIPFISSLDTVHQYDHVKESLKVLPIGLRN
jgi:hypothetical protein